MEVWKWGTNAMRRSISAGLTGILVYIDVLHAGWLDDLMLFDRCELLSSHLRRIDAICIGFD